MFCKLYFGVLSIWSMRLVFCKHYFEVLSILSILEYKTGVL